MASVNSLLKPTTLQTEVRDFKHASRTFVDNNYELQPKYSHLFHVVFNFTSEAATLFDTVDKLEMPILVKSIDLPTYTIDVQTHNQYNRKVQSHHGMAYHPINATFHDDAKDLIRSMWHKYYIFYNADATYNLNSNAYSAYDKYSDRVEQQWGFQRGNKRFFKDIKIYSMQNQKFAEYTLVNPIITSFGHDTHAYANSSFMQHQVQFAYETVKYATGYVNNISPKGFGEIHYDVERSDIAPAQSEGTVFIDGALNDVRGQEAKDMFQGNLIGTITDAEIIYNQKKPITTGNVITDTLAILANNILTGANPTNNIIVPITGLGEQLLGNLTSNVSNIASDLIVNSISGLFNGNVSTQGVNISSNNFISNATTADIGGANNVLVTSSNVPPKMSDIAPISISSLTSKTQKITEIGNRLKDTSISTSERTSLNEQLRLMGL